ncbi:MAG: fasciclin domain-containing protein [Caulobacterales bacterium]
MTVSTQTISATAAGSDSFKTLTAALMAADLTSVLEGTGPFTVFAPTDAALAKVPSATLSDLLLPANKEKLARILKFHVMSSKVMAADAAGKKLSPASVEGEALHVDGTDGVHVNGAKVSMADISCSNGVIHGIDAVLMPKA